MKFDRKNIDKRVNQGWGVYLIFSGTSELFSRRDYCKIGRAAGRSPDLLRRLRDNLGWHGSPKGDCGRGDNHRFQVLRCDTPTDAAKLEALFHVWHGNYPERGGRRAIEPKGRPSAMSEPDFFFVDSRGRSDDR